MAQIILHETHTHTHNVQFNYVLEFCTTFFAFFYFNFFLIFHTLYTGYKKSLDVGKIKQTLAGTVQILTKRYKSGRKLAKNVKAGPKLDSLAESLASKGCVQLENSTRTGSNATNASKWS